MTTWACTAERQHRGDVLRTALAVWRRQIARQEREASAKDLEVPRESPGGVLLGISGSVRGVSRRFRCVVF